MKYHFKVHKEGKGFWAQCIELPGCVTEGDSMEELQNNMQEALNLYIDEPEDSKELAPLPEGTIVQRVISWKYLLIHKLLLPLWYAIAGSSRDLLNNKRQRKWVLHTIYSYQRLENKSCNPSLILISKVKKPFPIFQSIMRWKGRNSNPVREFFPS